MCFLLQDFQNGLEFSLPFLMDHMTGMIVGLLKVLRATEGGEGDGEAQRRLDAQIRKLEKWNRLSHSVRTEREALFQELRYLSESGSDEELFRRALEVVSSWRRACCLFSRASRRTRLSK